MTKYLESTESFTQTGIEVKGPLYPVTGGVTITFKNGEVEHLSGLVMKSGTVVDLNGEGESGVVAGAVDTYFVAGTNYFEIYHETESKTVGGAISVTERGVKHQFGIDSNGPGASPGSPALEPGFLPTNYVGNISSKSDSEFNSNNLNSSSLEQNISSYFEGVWGSGNSEELHNYFSNNANDPGVGSLGVHTKNGGISINTQVVSAAGYSTRTVGSGTYTYSAGGSLVDYRYSEERVTRTQSSAGMWIDHEKPIDSGFYQASGNEIYAGKASYTASGGYHNASYLSTGDGSLVESMSSGTADGASESHDYRKTSQGAVSASSSSRTADGNYQQDNYSLTMGGAVYEKTAMSTTEGVSRSQTYSVSVGDRIVAASSSRTAGGDYQHGYYDATSGGAVTGAYHYSTTDYGAHQTTRYSATVDGAINAYSNSVTASGDGQQFSYDSTIGGAVDAYKTSRTAGGGQKTLAYDTTAGGSVDARSRSVTAGGGYQTTVYDLTSGGGDRFLRFQSYNQWKLSNG